MIQPLLIPTAAEKRIDTDFYVEGYATTFDKPYLLYEWDGNKYYERIDRNALAGADMSDVIMQYNHEGKVLARLSNGTLGVEANDTAGNTAGNAPCIFSQEFDNIVEQEYTNSVENLKTTAYVGGEEKEGVTRKVAEVGGSSTGLSRDEVFINATDIVQEYENESGQTVTLTNAQYLALLSARGVEELEQYAETLAFGSKINTNANLKYGTDYDLGDRVTCINKRWNVRIDVRITEIAETYETSGEEIDITFGESLPALLTQIRQITK